MRMVFEITFLVSVIIEAIHFFFTYFTKETLNKRMENYCYLSFRKFNCRRYNQKVIKRKMITNDPDTERAMEYLQPPSETNLEDETKDSIA